MKKYLVFTSLAILITGCSAGSIYPSVTSSMPSSTPSSNASDYVGGNIDTLKPGVLPDATLSPDEQKVISLLSKKISIPFPLKLGVLLYSQKTNFNQVERSAYFSDFISKLKVNPDVAQVSEIPNTLINTSSTIEDIRKLAARFQTSILIIINDTYQQSVQNDNKKLLPIDVLTGAKYWASSARIEVFALDIASGVFVSSESINISSVTKDSKDQNTQSDLDESIKKSAKSAWEQLIDKVNSKIDEVKKQSASK